jgi:hypothetical protein
VPKFRLLQIQTLLLPANIPTFGSLIMQNGIAACVLTGADLNFFCVCVKISTNENAFYRMVLIT